MSARIVKSELEVTRLSPAEAEVLVTVEVDPGAEALDLRGKLVGPRCPGVSTIQVAYPLRRLPSASQTGTVLLSAAAVIPEPNLWTPLTPYVYDATVELWQQGQRVDVAYRSIGLKQKRES
jgi:beta-galactosidase/beta-glucuronidase